jgi:phosphoribosylaminoimidazolecarboxamide formyltransferase/IMP cyclohydrolase
VASYDTAIAEYLRREEPGFPEHLTVALERKLSLRYGENPHQEAAFYAERSVLSPGPRGIAAAEQLHGKELSYNNILDADAAWNAAVDFAEPTVVIVKHTNPCGLASRDDLAEAFRLAFEGDPVSAFGGIVAVNRPVTKELAQAIRETRSPSSGQRLFLEIIIAPGYEPEAVEVLQKSRDLRILRVPEGAQGGPVGLEYRRVNGGMLVQTFDAYPDEALELRTVTQRAPTEAELADLRFAWKAVKHVKSNAIVLVKDRALVGMGAGQPNRVTSVHLAARAAGERAAGSVLASDAFFPFADNVELAAEAGVTAIVEPGGSIRDEDVIRAADARGIAMVFTGVRHFRH